MNKSFNRTSGCVKTDSLKYGPTHAWAVARGLADWSGPRNNKVEILVIMLIEREVYEWLFQNGQIV